MLRFMGHAVLAAALLLAPASASATESFVDGLEDVPLMVGLDPLPDRSVVFDKPNGRIVESYAAGAVRRAEVVRFYDTTMPQLGWTGRSPAYRREGEVLRIGFEGRDGDLVVRFSLSPR
ncbi:hypothetical protein EDC65_2594 [Stella humosa]|uniref:Nickel/cobalt transporter regulator n=1 Tax=Stella humosa TaxID=94 RepID=A0A3N1LGV0_9PROT|nr:hypothetical protein [Stella humosa]ROP90737.1 hypothetical protein EDC65_2594 [Stella humosa]BBK34920.1 hypothetical protein STHU_55540 [Stella humosa]